MTRTPVCLFARLVIGLICVLAAGVSARAADPLPTITSVGPGTVYQNYDANAIIIVRGTNFFTASGGSHPTSPNLVLRRSGFADKVFSGNNFSFSSGTAGGDNTNGWIMIGMDLSGYPVGGIDIGIQRPSTNLGEVYQTGALTIKASTSEQLMSRGVWGGSVTKAVPVGNRLYISSGRRLVILDQTDEHNLIELGSIDLKAAVLDLAVSGNYAYVVTSNVYQSSLGSVSDPFIVVDVSNPSAPQRVWSGNANGFGNPWSIGLYGSTAYVGTDQGYVMAFNITTPAATVPLGPLSGIRQYFNPPGRAQSPKVSGSKLVVFTGQYTIPDGNGNEVLLKIFDLSTGPVLSPPLVGTWSPPASDDFSIPSITTYGYEYLRVLTVAGNRAAIAVARFDPSGVPYYYYDQIYVVDFSTPATPVQVSTHSYPSGQQIWNYNTSIDGLSLAGNVLVVADNELTFPGTHTFANYPGGGPAIRGVEFFDITTPQMTSLTTGYTHSKQTYGVDVVGDRAYLYDMEGLEILDLSALPAFPTLVNEIFSPAMVTDMVRNGNLLYVGDYFSGLSILDISDTNHPQLVGRYQTNHTQFPDLLVAAAGIAYANGTVYMTVGDWGDISTGIEGIDVTDPAHPTLANYFTYNGMYHSPTSVEISGNILHMGGAMWLPLGVGTQCLPEYTNFDISSGGIALIGSIDFRSSPNYLGDDVAYGCANRTLITVNGITASEAALIDNTNPSSPQFLPYPAAPNNPPSGSTAARESPFQRGVTFGPGGRLYSASAINGPKGQFWFDIPQLTGHTSSGTFDPFGTTECDGLIHNGVDRLYVLGDGHTISAFDTSLSPTSAALVTALDDGFAMTTADGFRNGYHAKLRFSSPDLFVAGTFDRTLVTSSGLAIVEHVRPPATVTCCRGTTCLSVATGTCTGVVAGSASTVVSACGPNNHIATCCYGDYDHNGTKAIDDIFVYLNAWFARSPYAKVGGDGTATPAIDDIFLFLNVWFAGCS